MRLPLDQWLTPEILSFHRCYLGYCAGHLPEGPVWNDQPATFIDAALMMDAEIHKNQEAMREAREGE